MSHHIYETKSLVLAALPSGESDRQVLLYTREFGLVYASARGLRELKSKLRYNLQPYSCSIVNLVRTQGGWRITGARLETDYFSLVRRDHKRLMVLAHVHALLRRMLAGQERQVALFDALAEGLSFFLRVPDAALAEAELLLVLCILYHLGYVGNMLTLRTLFTEGLWSDEALRFASRDRGTLVRSVNESLRASHL